MNQSVKGIKDYLLSLLIMEKNKYELETALRQLRYKKIEPQYCIIANQYDIMETVREGTKMIVETSTQLMKKADEIAANQGTMIENLQKIDANVAITKKQRLSLKQISIMREIGIICAVFMTEAKCRNCIDIKKGVLKGGATWGENA